MHSVAPFSRTDTSLLGRWWWTVDRWVLSAVLLLMLIGAALALAASPAAAERIGLDSFHFARQQLLFLPVALVVMLGVSLLSRTGVQRIGSAGTVLSIVLLALTLVIGLELNGARRWLPLGGFHLQPSEFVKPCLAVFMAAVLARSNEEQLPYGKLIASIPVIVAALLLVLQPDIGMATTVAGVWLVQMFVAGMPLALAVLGGAATAGRSLFRLPPPHARQEPHRPVHRPHDRRHLSGRHLAPRLRGRRAFRPWPRRRNGQERAARCPTPTSSLPLPPKNSASSHASSSSCCSPSSSFAASPRAMRGGDLFSLVAVAGLLAQFGFQALINMGVAIRLLPAKGMTLPFLSYGGSSTMATAIGLGMVLALTRERRSGEGYVL